MFLKSSTKEKDVPEGMIRVGRIIRKELCHMNQEQSLRNTKL